ncbi:MAG: NADH-quinone oxidoreductase subunit J [Alphaproteobacteria bacterium]|nr:NADH-quinone oxidoreductase subunit J [Alphaproteobacteria bacterium]
MNFTLLLFYLFSFILISSAVVVVSTRNMVHAVMFLVLAFLNAAALFILLNAEFLAMLLIIVYVGAIAVLFLFVVMMLNIDLQISQEVNRKRPIFILVGVILFTEIFLLIKFSSVKFYETKTLFQTPIDISNTKAIGNVLYTDFLLPFQLSGAVLFVAMIGAIVLTLRDETRFIRKQKVSDQTARDKANSLEVVKVRVGEGINI